MCKKEYKDMEEVYNDPEKFKELLRIGDPDDYRYLTSYGQAKKKWYDWVKKHTKIILILTSLPIIILTVLLYVITKSSEAFVLFFGHGIYLFWFWINYKFISWNSNHAIVAPFVGTFIFNFFHILIMLALLINH